MAEKPSILITRIAKHSEVWIDGSPILVYEVETETGQMTFAITIAAAKDLRAMPEKLPPDLGRTSGLQEIL
jgi:hypothetical protein